MNECDLCYEPTRNRKPQPNGGVLCTGCREAIAYYDSLTPAEWAEEERMIAEYVAEHEREPF